MINKMMFINLHKKFQNKQWIAVDNTTTYSKLDWLTNFLKITSDYHKILKKTHFVIIG